MNDIKIALVAHLILGPLGVWIMADDAAHPERWGTWYRDPSISIPLLIAEEVVLWGLLFSSLIQERRAARRFARGVRLMAEANRLRAQGRYREAEPLWQEGVRLTGEK